MSSMEPSLQPSFTFPSRHDLQNYAKGILDLSSATQRLLVKPKQNTDIDIQTSLQSVLTVPKTLDKDVIDVKAVIPVDTNIYVQPGLAEGMTNLAKLTHSDKEIMSVTSANNAMKRGNYKAAEKLIGRPVTVEEMANHSVTPETRASEAHPGVKTGVSFNGIAFGAQVDRNSQYNFHQREKMLREAEPYFVNQMADHLGIDAHQVRMLKTQMAFTGDSVLGFKNGHPRVRQEIMDQFEYAWKAMQAGRNPELQQYRREAEGEPIHAGQRALRAMAQDNRQRALEREPPRTTYAPMEVESKTKSKKGKSEPYKGEPPQSASGPAPSFMIVDEDNMQHTDMEWDEMKRENYPPPPREFHGASYMPMQEVSDQMLSEIHIPVGGGPPIIHPPVLDTVVVNVPMAPVRANEETDDRLIALAEANIPNRDEDMSYFPPDEVKLEEHRQRESDEVYLRNSILGRRKRIEDEEEEEEHDETDHRWKRQTYREDETGGGIGTYGRRRTMKRQHFKPHAQTNRFTPQVDGFFPAGGVLSGNLMKQTGRNAVPLSAQIQVSNTHQWTETPLQDWVRHPNYQTENRTRPIPIAQNTGVGRRTKKVRFGEYMLDQHKLVTGGVLSLSHPTGKKVKGMPNREISSGLREVIHAIVTGQKVNTKKLTASERLQLKDLMSKSAAAVDLGGDVNVTPTQQLSLILGEIEAGNDSEELKSQLRKLLPSLKRGKCLTADQASDISKHYL